LTDVTVTRPWKFKHQHCNCSCHRGAAAGDAGKIGICHGRVGSNLPPPSAAAALLKQNGITKARLFLPDPAVLPAFAAAGIDLMVGVPNENLTFLAASGPEGSARWLRSAVLAHAPAERARYLAFGNEVLYNNQFYAPHLVPAMRNLHSALAALGLGGRVKVSSAHASSVLAASYPTSAGAFDAASLGPSPSSAPCCSSWPTPARPSW